jgi:hypothetical protein
MALNRRTGCFNDGALLRQGCRAIVLSGVRRAGKLETVRRKWMDHCRSLLQSAIVIAMRCLHTGRGRAGDRDGGSDWTARSQVVCSEGTPPQSGQGSGGAGNICNLMHVQVVCQAAASVSMCALRTAFPQEAHEKTLHERKLDIRYNVRLHADPSSRVSGEDCVTARWNN